ncbi:hypothetical protein [Paucimonas lemoignei]|nr:hypothetical protein [Paucimonas lemoignei]
MTLIQKFVLGALTAVPLAAMSQGSPRPHPQDAGVPVSAVTYVSPFKNYRAATDAETTPDRRWRRANEAVGRIGGHAGHGKVQAEGMPAPSQTTSQASAQARASSQAQAVSPDRLTMPSHMDSMHRDHSEHGHHGHHHH